MRSYDPYLERFLQPDPSARDGVRSYVYAHNDPVDLADPSGLAGGPGSNEPPPVSVVEAGGLRVAPGEVLPVAQPSGEAVLTAPETANGDAQVTTDPVVLDGRAARNAQQAGQLPLPGFRYESSRRLAISVEGDAREAIVEAQLQEQYPTAQIYAERDIVGADLNPLIDPATNAGRRFDFVVIEGGEIVDVVEVTAPNVDKTEQFAKTTNILALNPGNAYIRIPGTRTLVPLPATFTGERLERVRLP